MTEVRRATRDSGRVGAATASLGFRAWVSEMSRAQKTAPSLETIKSSQRSRLLFEAHTIALT